METYKAETYLLIAPTAVRYVSKIMSTFPKMSGFNLRVLCLVRRPLSSADARWPRWLGSTPPSLRQPSSPAYCTTATRQYHRPVRPLGITDIPLTPRIEGKSRPAKMHPSIFVRPVRVLRVFRGGARYNIARNMVLY